MKQPIMNVVRNESDNTAKILLYGIIGEYWSEDPLTAQKFIRLLASLEKNYNTINVHIHSPGGDVYEGLAICNAIKASKKTINTYNDGIAMSMGACILACGKNRYAAKGSITMIHNASTISWGTAETLRKDAGILDTIDDVLAEYFADAMAKSLETIKATYFDHDDHFLSAKDGEKLGLFTITEIDAEDVPENVHNLEMHQVAAFYRTNKNPQNKNSDMFGKDKFKSLSALAKIAVADITAEMVNAINEEIESEKIPGITVVLDSEIETTTAEAVKVPGLTTQVSDLQKSLDAEKKKVKDQEVQIAALKKELGTPAVEHTGPHAGAPDKTLGDEGKPENEFRTSVDAEAEKYFS